MKQTNKEKNQKTKNKNKNENRSWGRKGDQALWEGVRRCESEGTWKEIGGS
jgi:hypothetical protein